MNHHLFFRSGAALVAGLAVPGVLLRADVLHLRNGGRLEGEVTESGDVYRLSTRTGVVTVPKSDVASVERGAGTREAYAAKKAEFEAYAAKAGPPSTALGAGEAPPTAEIGAAERALGLWCRDRGLRAEAAGHLAAADRRLGGDAACAKALTALGWVRWDAQWMPKAEAMTRLGYVQKDGRWVRQELAAADAVRAAKEKEARELLRRIGGTDAGRRKKAEAALAAIPGEHKLRPFLDALDEPNERVREHAARGLGEVHDFKSLTPLVNLALADRSDDVRRAAVESVQALAGRSAVQPFVRALETLVDPFRRTNAARALAQIADPRAAPAVYRRYVRVIGGGAEAASDSELTLGGGHYVSDLDTSAGAFASGFDPEVGSVQSGASLGVGPAGGEDAAARERERLVLIVTLERLTGRNYGDNAIAWAAWWRERAGKNK